MLGFFYVNRVRWRLKRIVCRFFLFSCLGAVASMAPLVFTLTMRCSPPTATAPDNTVSWIVMTDTAVTAGDTVCLYATASASGETVVGYLWQRGGTGDWHESTAGTGCCMVWSVADTGRHVMVLRARFASGGLSEPESIRIWVRLCRPVARLVSDSVAWVGDTITVRCADSAPCAAIVGYAWSCDSGKTWTDTTREPLLRIVWTVVDTGVRWVAVRSIDARGVASLPSMKKVVVSECRLRLIVKYEKAVLWSDTTELRFETPWCKTQPAGYLVLLDSRSVDTVKSGSYRHSWSIGDTGMHTFAVKVFDKNGVVRDSIRCTVVVTDCRPMLSVDIDTPILAETQSIVRIKSQPQCGMPLTYFWSLKTSSTELRDTTDDPWLVKEWKESDTGIAAIEVNAVTREGIVARGAVATVRVIRPVPPKIRLSAKTTVTIFDTVVIDAIVVDSSCTIERLWWSVDGETPRATRQRYLLLCWGREDVGSHTVRVVAEDSHGRMSAVDSVQVKVVLDSPVITSLPDTIVRLNDTVRLALSASDSAGSIASYYWGLQGRGWSDSSSDPVARIVIATTDTVLRVVYGVRDDDGIWAVDTVVLRINHPPEAVRLIALTNGDTVYFSLADLRAGGGRLRVSFGAEDRNGTADTLRYRFFLGKSSVAMAKVYEGTIPNSEIDNLDTGLYYWRLVCTDRAGDSADATGKIRCSLRRTICFVGHSIIVGGTIGKSGEGGFRREVLDSMRSFYRNATVRPIGVMRTGYLLPEEDDSAVALGGIYAAQAIAMLISAPTLAADEWVVMLGVNRQYNYDEQRDVPALIDTLHMRNPHSAIYVINGLKCPDNFVWYNYYLPTFNRILADTVASKQSQGWNIKLIDAYNEFMDGTVRRESYFADELHPNVDGFSAIARLILKAMGIMR